jgi:hypothetical protein
MRSCGGANMLSIHILTEDRSSTTPWHTAMLNAKSEHLCLASQVCEKRKQTSDGRSHDVTFQIIMLLTESSVERHIFVSCSRCEYLHPFTSKCAPLCVSISEFSKWSTPYRLKVELDNQPSHKHRLQARVIFCLITLLSHCSGIRWWPPAMAMSNVHLAFLYGAWEGSANHGPPSECSLSDPRGATEHRTESGLWSLEEKNYRQVRAKVCFPGFCFSQALMLKQSMCCVRLLAPKTLLLASKARFLNYR